MELKGVDSVKPLYAFSALMLGVKMLPDYHAVSYEDFFELIEGLSPEAQEKIIRTAAKVVELKPDEILGMALFVKDPNGVRYTAENIKNLGPRQIVDIITAVSLKVAEAMRAPILTDSEKKNSKTLA
jgi:hypothetical protein